MKFATFSFMLLLTFTIFAQQKKDVLFIGNSYTAFNNLAQLTANIAASTGDTLNFETHTPGGTRFLNHAVNTTALNLIASKNWDFVTLQGQSQEPSFPFSQAENEVFPYAKILCDSIRSNNECSVPLFYMTWGRENGDAQNCGFYSTVCTYEGMDSLLTARYLLMAENNNAKVSPIGMVWRYIRENHQNINLYSADGSHPSIEGSFLAACTFYTLIFNKDVTNATFNSTLTDSTAQIIKNAAKLIAFNNLNNYDFTTLNPVSNFNLAFLNTEGTAIELLNTSQNANSFLWNFGDGNTSTEENIAFYNYNQPTVADTVYTISLISENCEITDTFSTDLTIEVVLDIVNNINDSSNASSVFDSKSGDIECACNQNFNEFFNLINMYNSNGKLIKSIKNAGVSAKISTNNLPKQIYIVEMITNKKRYINKIPVF